MGYSQQNQQHPTMDAKLAAGGLAGASESLKRSASSRMQFVQKVYLTLLSGLGAGGVAGLAAYSSPPLAPIGGMLHMVSIASLLLGLFMRKNKIVGAFTLYTFCSAMGMSLGLMHNALVADGQGHVVWMALGVGTATFGGLTAYVFATRKDFSFLGGFLHTMLWGMFISSMLSWMFGWGLGGNFLYTILGIVMVSGFILYDTHRVLEVYDDDEYFQAAWELAWDFFYLVIKLVQLFVDRD